VENTIIQNLILSLRTILDTIRLSDLIDIAVMSFVIYKLMWMVRKSSSGRVLRGVLFFLLVVLLCSELNLYATSFLLSRALEWGVVMLVVLFQPELRRFLERMGSGLGLSDMFGQHTNPVHEIDQSIAETVDAYTTMSRNKVGALMVFERKDLLDDVIKTGTTLDCAISSELLKNLFWDKAPLHDGAIIVRNGRIVAAGCMLPLSGNVNLSRELGMRHRAGIGISEHSDAVVVIVSEETGSISAAVGGMLKRHLAPDTLSRLLRNELLADTGEEVQTANRSLFMRFIFNRWKKEDGAE